jgi:transcriptional regulator with XRE-family HTH domain
MMDNNDKINFAKIIGSIMREHGLTQLALAKLIGIRQGQVSNWVHGKSLPNYHYLRKLLNELKLDANKLF